MQGMSFPRTSLRSGTIMESSELSFLIWYKAMFLMSRTKKGFSAKEMQKQLELKRYEPVFEQWFINYAKRWDIPATVFIVSRSYTKAG